MFLAHLTWQEAERVLQQEDLVVVIPTGSTEQHGPIAPLGTDFIIPDHLAALIEERTGALIVPTMPFGVAPHHTSFPGTIDIGADGLYLVVKGIVSNLMKHGAKRFLFLNGHGGNDPVLDNVGLEAFREGGLCAQINWWSLAPALNPEWITGHGDAQETAMIRAIDHSLIKGGVPAPVKVNHLSENLVNTHLNQVLFANAHVKIIRDVRATADIGGFGGLDSGLGALEWGQAMKEAVLEYCIMFVEEFKKTDLDKARRHA